MLAIVQILLNATMAFAASGGHEAGVPKVVLYQTINVAIVFVGLFFILRKPVAEYFKSKKESYIAAQQKASAFLKKAESEHLEIKTRLMNLENTHEQALEKARLDAHEIQKQMAADAEAFAFRLKKEAELAARVELERAKAEIRDLILKEAFAAAQRDLSTKPTAEDQRRLQKDFISKVQVV